MAEIKNQATEKQINFIKSLLQKKNLEYFEIQHRYHAKSGGRFHLVDDINELSKREANFVIEELLNAPDRRVVTEKTIQKFQNACDLYEKLIEFAKSKGAKVRKRMKTKNVLEALYNVGIKLEDLPAEFDSIKKKYEFGYYHFIK